jgi:transposase
MESQGKPLAPTHRRYTAAQREQAVPLVRQIRAETGEQHGAIQRVARQLGFGVETVRKWVNQADVDAGERPGTTTEDNAKIRRLEHENRELRRANEILKSASSWKAMSLVRHNSTNAASTSANSGNLAGLEQVNHRHDHLERGLGVVGGSTPNTSLTRRRGFLHLHVSWSAI